MKKRTAKKSLTGPILINIILFILGICLLVWANKVTSFISITIGALFVLYAIYIFIDYLRSEKRSNSKIITSIALIIAGAFLIIENSFLAELISYIIGVFIIIVSMFKIQDAFDLRKSSTTYKTPLVFAIISLCCGVFCIAGKIILPDLIIQILGVMLIIFAITHSTSTIIVDHAPTVVEHDAIEAEIIDKKDAKHGQK